MRGDFIAGSKRNHLTTASQEDLWYAAEAVVDAAMCSKYARGHIVLSDNERQVLVQAVFTDPKLTSNLFRNGSMAFH